ncbi:MAG: endonuclease [Modestobacter sp.]|nr:endonuclease [Modestobacter sp.]
MIGELDEARYIRVEDLPSDWYVPPSETELIADIWSSDARMRRQAAQRARAIDALARRRRPTLDRPAGSRGAAGRDMRSLWRHGLEDVSESFVPELALIRGCSEHEAERVAVEALVLVRHLPASWEALHEGRLDERKAAVLVELLGPVSREVAEEVQRRVLDDVETRTAPQLRARVRRLLARLDADALEKRREEAALRADVRHRPVGDGMSQLTVDLPTPLAAACADACDQYAQMLRADGDQRPIGALRAAAAADLILRPWDARPAVTANLTVHAPLSGLQATSDRSPAPAAEVTGQLVTAQQCRELLEELEALGVRAPECGSVQVAVHDPLTGRLVTVATPRELRRGASGRRTRRRGVPVGEPGSGSAGVGLGGVGLGGVGLGPPASTTAYRPTAEQRRFVQARDRTCRWPGCRRSSGRCDLDHVEPYADGGETECSNLCCLCRRHHRLKTFGPGWGFRMDAEGRLRVRTPSGVERVTSPPGWCWDAEPDPPWLAEEAAPDPLSA